MKKILVLFLLTFSITVSAQNKPVQKTTQSLLFQVSGKGIKSPSYIFGTYHFIGKDFLDSLPGVLTAFNKAKMVVGEMVIENESAMYNQMMPHMLLKEQTLEEVLSAAEFKQVDSLLEKESGMQLAMLNGMKPVAVQLTILSFITPKTISPENPPLDIYFQSEAKQANKKVQGLETLEQQAKIIFDVPIQRQKEQLIKMVREKEKYAQQSKALFNSYKKQDLNAIGKLFLKSDDYTPKELEEILYKRNRSWVAQIPGIIKKEPSFIAVGAGHLVGEKGIISMLRKQGYMVKAISTLH